MAKNGYDNNLSLSYINDQNNGQIFSEIEIHTNNNLHEIIMGLKCCLSDTYKSEIMKKQFRFAPGHKTFILHLAKKVKESLSSPSQTILNQIEGICSRVKNDPAFSNILKEIVQSAIINTAKPPNLHTFPDKIKFFSTYIYMLSGRKCYGMLQRNLKLPAVSTIGT